VLYLAVAAAAAAATFGWRALAPCGLGDCPPPTAAPPPRDRVAVALAPSDDPTATPADETVGRADGPAVPTPPAEDDRPLGTNRIDTLLAAERGDPAPAIADPTTRIVRTTTPRPVPAATPTVRAPAAVASAVRTAARPSPVATPLPEATADTVERDAPEIIIVERPPLPRRDGWIARAERDAFDPRGEPRAEEDVDDEPDLSGRWLLTNAIEDTSYGPYAGMRIRFRVRLEQHGDRIVGHGEKFTVDDKPVPPSQRTPIMLEGSIRGRDVTVSFVERGTRRASHGGFHWRVSPDGKRLQGTLDSSAGNARGRSHASRDG
jgi:hypothetical protein